MKSLTSSICLNLVFGTVELEASFQRLSSLLTVHTNKLNVLVSPLRAAILQVGCVCVWGGE